MEAAVTVNVEDDGLHAALQVAGDGESLRDGGLHLADGATRLRVEIHACTAFTVHNEVAAGLPFLGHLDEVVDGLALAPSYVDRLKC